MKKFFLKKKMRDNNDFYSLPNSKKSNPTNQTSIYYNDNRQKEGKFDFFFLFLKFLKNKENEIDFQEKFSDTNNTDYEESFPDSSDDSTSQEEENNRELQKQLYPIRSFFSVVLQNEGLRTTLEDHKEMEKLFEDYLGFDKILPSIHLKQHLSTKANIFSKLKEFKNIYKEKNGLFVFYFGGHGFSKSENDKEESFIVLWDKEELRISELIQKISEINCLHKLLSKKKKFYLHFKIFSLN